MKDEKEPEGLPEVDIEYPPETPVQGIRCPKCGGIPRIVSNSAGVQAYCGPCGYDWPISNAIPQPYNIHPLMPRGVHKRVSVEPDVNIAFEPIDPDEEMEDENTRRRRAGKRRKGPDSI